VRIGLVTTSYPRFPGDLAGGFVAEHAAFLVRAGYEVDVIAAASSVPDSAGPVSSAPVAAGGGGRGFAVSPVPAATGADASAARVRELRVDRVRAWPGLFDGAGAPEELAAGGGAWWSAAAFSLALAARVARGAARWDAVIAHWLVPSGLAALIAAPHLPLLAIAHSGDVHLLRRIGAIGGFGALFRRRGDARLSFVSDELRRLFLARAPGCAALSQVCPMGVDLARLRDARLRRDRADGDRPRDDRASGDPTVLFLGRLVPIKGADVLIAAAARWRSGARLVVAGAGPEEGALRRLAATAPSGRVRFAGPVFGAERDRALAGADLVAVPSLRAPDGRSEGLPVVALEAMAAGAALIASAVGGLTELPGEAITRVTPGDPDDLAAAVDRLALDPARRRAQIAAQDRVVAAFDWNEVGPRLLPPIRSSSTASPWTAPSLTTSARRLSAQMRKLFRGSV